MTIRLDVLTVLRSALSPVPYAPSPSLLSILYSLSGIRKVKTIKTSIYKYLKHNDDPRLDT